MATTFDENGTNTPNGGHLEFSYTFDVIKNEDVKVALNGVTQAATKYTLDTTTNPKKIIFNNTSVDSSLQQSTGAPKSGVIVKVYRDTDVDAARVDFQPGSGIRAADLNTNQKQVLYALQEEQNQKGIFESISLDDDVQIKLGNNNDFTIEWDTAGSPDAGVLKAGSIDIKSTYFKIRDFGGDQILHADLNGILVSENFKPTSDNTFDLGSNNHQWKDLYVNGVAYLDEIDLGDDQKLKFGDNDDFTIYWKNSSSDAKLESDNDIIYDSGSGHKFTKDGASVLTLWSSAADFKVHVRPWNDDTWDLGSSSYQWRNLYVDGTGYIDTVSAENLTVSGTTTLAAGSIGTSEIADSNVTTVKIANDAVTRDKIGTSAVGTNEIDSGSITSALLQDNAVITAKIANDAVTVDKLANDSVGADQILANGVGTTEIVNNAITQDKIADNAITNAKLNSDSVGADEIIQNAVGTSEIAPSAVTASELADNAVTIAKIADAELTTLAGMQAGTASKLADSTALTADIADLNQIDGLTKQTTISNSDASFPTSGAVVDYVASQLDPVGGLEVIATDAAFPNTQPASGVVVSIADAGGLVVNGSGVSTTGRTVGGSTVTINNINSQFNSTTIDNGVAMMVSSTGSGQVYNYHKATLREQDILSISSDIQSFGNRYRVGSSNPTSDNDAGDLFFNTATDKLLVRNAANNSWDEAQSVGNFYISTLSPAFDGSTTDFTITNAPTYASQVLLIINGVLQKPNAGTSAPADGFALDGSTVKLGGAPATGSTYSAVVIGSTVNIGTPSDNTVSTAVLQNGSVTTAKIADNAVDSLKLANNSVDTGALQDLNVTTAKIAADAVTGAKIADDAVGAEHIEVLDANLQLADSVKIQVGTGNDLELYHDGTNSWISNSTGALYLKTAASNSVYILDNNNDTIFRAVDDGATELYYDNSKKFETTSTGATVTGDLVPEANATRALGSGSYRWAGAHITALRIYTDTQYYDNAIAKFGHGEDLQIYHDGSHSYISDTGTGYLLIKGSEVQIQSSTGEDMAKFIPDGAAELYYDSNRKLHTVSGGIYVTGNIYANNTGTTAAFSCTDNGRSAWGSDNDLVIYHDGTDNRISAGSDGRAGYVAYITNDGNNSDRYGIRIQCGADDASGSNYAIAIADGNNTYQGAITFSGGTVTYGTFTAYHPCIVPDSENPSDSSNAYPYGTLLETISIEYTQKNGANTERGIRYKVQKTQSANSRKVLGAYGSSMNGGPDGQTNEHQALVLGDGHILVNNAGGNIEVGDGICSSATAGIGQKATANPSMIIGIAQEAVTFTGSETKLVAVQYGLQQFIPWT